MKGMGIEPTDCESGGLGGKKMRGLYVKPLSCVTGSG